jgi:DNA polymerase-4
MAGRCVAHLDMDAFYVAVELQRRPALRGQPVVVAGSGPRAVVTTASYEARQFGVASAVPAARARRLCPQAVFLEPDFAYYRQASGVVMDLVRSHLETVEVVGLDEAYLDLSRLPAPKAAMRRLVREIKARTGLSCSVGIGPNKLVAKVASDAEKPRGFVVLTQAEACARFASAPCGLIPGIGPKTVERLQAQGIGTLGELSAAAPAELAQRFGPRLGAELQRRARFEDGAAVTQERKVVSESRETTFDVDIADRARLEVILAGLAERLWAALEAQGRQGRTVSIKVRLADFSTYTRAHTLSEPVGSGRQLMEVALRLLRRHPPAGPVRLLGVRVAGLAPAETGGDRQLVLSV